MKQTTRQILKEAKLLSSHWGRRIMAAQKRGKFTHSDDKRSMAWLDCACGKVSADIKRDSDGTPCDKVLYNLGVTFCGRVESNRFRDAALCLVEIERRAAQLRTEQLQFEVA